MKEYLKKLPLVGVWISLIGSSILLYPILELLYLEINAVSQDGMFIFWHKSDSSYAGLITVSLVIWFVFPLIYVGSYKNALKVDRTKKVFIFSGFVNFLMLILPMAAIILTKFTDR